MSQSIEVLKSVGVDIVNYRLSNSSSQICFDAKNQEFIIMNGDNVVAYTETSSNETYTKPTNNWIFKFTSSYDKNSTYGQYLKDGYEVEDSTAAFEVTSSFDCGNNTNIKNVQYVGDESNPKDVILRTYCEALTIHPKKDTIYHFNETNDIYLYGDSANPCNYYEAGKAAYLYAEYAVMNFFKVDSKDCSEVDVFEFGKGVTAGALWTQSAPLGNDGITIVISEETQISETIPRTLTPITHVDNWDTTAATSLYQKITVADNYYFIRLDADITIPSSVATAITLSGITKCIDLCGHKLVDESGITTAALFLIESATAETEAFLTLLDCYRNTDKDTGGLHLKHRIEAKGDGVNKKIAGIYLDGLSVYHTASITSAPFKASSSNSAAAGTGRYKYDSYLYVYGGSINSVKGSTNESKPYCIWCGTNSYVQVNYGVFNSEHVCIGSDSSNDNNYIDIVGGDFKSTEAECIYIPQNCELNISGGTFEGRTCICAKDGNINISGGTFKAVGEWTQHAYSTSGGGTPNGTVIQLDGHKGYGATTVINITNATMSSESGYIFEGVYDDSYNGHCEIYFFGGKFSYAKDEPIWVQDGGVSSGKIYYLQSGGIWTKKTN